MLRGRGRVGWHVLAVPLDSLRSSRVRSLRSSRDARVPSSDAKSEEPEEAKMGRKKTALDPAVAPVAPQICLDVFILYLE